MQTDSTTARVADSAAVLAKASQLAVRYEGRGRFSVASGSEPGECHHVQAPRWCRDSTYWSCTCAWAQHGGKACAHVRAAEAELERLTRRVRARVRGEAVAK